MIETPGRNSRCSCGSGRKYKHCCLGRDAVIANLPRVPNAFARAETPSEREKAVRHYELGLVELAAKRPASAVTALNRALALDPTLVAGHNNLGIALKDLGRLDDAEIEYRKALDLDPGYAASHHNLGELFQRRGQLEEARRCFENALQADPRLIQSRISLGNVLADRGEFEGAVRCYEKSIVQSPAPARIYMNLGIVLQNLGNTEGALEAFKRVVADIPNSVEAHFNLSGALLESGRFGAAIETVQEAIRLRPEFPEAHALYAVARSAAGDIDGGIELLRPTLSPEVPIGQVFLILAAQLMKLKLFDQARCCLERALQEQPADAMARHLLAALSGENPDHPVEGYVRQLFDAGAATFDKELVSGLKYGIPRAMVEALLAIDGARPEPWDVLDLGCGTGLVGVEIASHVRSLVGIDLAAKMIERAREHDIYAELRCADLMKALEEEEDGRYDVITAADVFIYVGKLDDVIPAVRRLLRPHGLFAFSAEAAEGMTLPIGAPSTVGYWLGNMGRYAHNADYLNTLAVRNRFDVKLLSRAQIRLEHRHPVEGWLTVWGATES